MNEEFLIMKFYSHQVRSDSIFRIIFLFKTTRKLSQTSAAITNEQQLRWQQSWLYYTSLHFSFVIYFFFICCSLNWVLTITHRPSDFGVTFTFFFLHSINTQMLTQSYKNLYFDYFQQLIVAKYVTIIFLTNFMTY